MSLNGSSTNVELSIKMRLLIATGFWPSKENSISGIFVAQQVAAFVRLGYQVTILSGNTIGRPASPRLTPSELGLPEERVAMVSYPLLRLPEHLSGLPGGITLNTATTGISMCRLIRKLVRSHGPFDAAIIHALRYAGFALPTWRHLIQGKVLTVCHGVDPFLEQPGNIKRSIPLLQKMVGQCEKLVLVGQPLRTHVHSLGLSQECLAVIPNGTDLPDRTEVSEGQRALDIARRIVSVSNLVALKGIDLNLRALARISATHPQLKWEYVIVGEGPLRYELETLSAELGLTERVRFLGRISYAGTMQAIAAADIFSLPSWGEAFGIVYLEAMARMCPVIGCLDNGAADIINDGVDGLLIPPHDEVALAQALESLLSDPEGCGRMGVAGRQTSEGFSWQANAQRMLSLLGLKVNNRE